MFFKKKDIYNIYIVNNEVNGVFFYPKNVPIPRIGERVFIKELGIVEVYNIEYSLYTGSGSDPILVSIKIYTK